MRLLKIGETVTATDGKAEVVGMAFFDKNNELVYNGKDGVLLYCLKYEDGLQCWTDPSEIQEVAVEIINHDDFFDTSRSPELLERGYNMVAWSDGLEDRPDNMKLYDIFTLLSAIQYDKEGGYGSSWKGKGEYRGVMANIDRKYDRLDKMTMDEIEGKIKTLSEIESYLADTNPNKGKIEVGESKIDAIADLANYCLLYMTFVRDNYPNVFKVWVERNLPKYLADKIPFIQE